MSGNGGILSLGSVQYFYFGKGGGVGRGTREKVREAIVHKVGSKKYQHD
jgi:hypothetical protein